MFSSLTWQIKRGKLQFFFEMQARKTSFLKLIERCVMDALKREKNDKKFFFAIIWLI